MTGPKDAHENQQLRGAAWDIVDEAILAYSNFMLDDDYDYKGALEKIIYRMMIRRAMYRGDEVLHVNG